MERLYDGVTLKGMFQAAEAHFRSRVEEVNAINVFPVPDSDSGTNLQRTLQAALRALQANTESAAQVAYQAARGALLGARGNSGVIFSQILKGFARGLEGKDRFSCRDLAQAMVQAAEAAYKSVINPVEGTILTVVRDAAEAAQRAAQMGSDLAQVLREVVGQARAAVERTPQLLPVLREAGVVDSGAKGLYYILEGMYRYVTGSADAAGLGALQAAGGGPAATGEPAAEVRYGYEVQFLLEGSNLDVEAIRAAVARMGESVLVVGDENLVKVHVHTLDPDRVIQYGRQVGAVRELTLENLDEQARAFRRRIGKGQAGPTSGG